MLMDAEAERDRLIAENECLTEDVESLERFRALRTRHNDEMQRRTSELEQMRIENGRLHTNLKASDELANAANDGWHDEHKRAEAWKLAAESQVQAGLDMCAQENGLISIKDTTASCERAGRLLNAARELEQEKA
jgi:hypothetical protein